MEEGERVRHVIYKNDQERKGNNITTCHLKNVLKKGMTNLSIQHKGRLAGTYVADDPVCLALGKPHLKQVQGGRHGEKQGNNPKVGIITVIAVGIPT